MSTTKIAATLYQLQQLDLELERLIAEQQALESSLQGDSVLKRLQAEHNIAQQQLQLGLQAQKEAEWALEELDRRMRMQEQRLYSGVVTNPKELYALQQEVQHLRAQQNRQEEMALEVILTTESLQEVTNSKAERPNSQRPRPSRPTLKRISTAGWMPPASQEASVRAKSAAPPAAG